MSRLGVFKINGVDYDLDDLTLEELELFEEMTGGMPGDGMDYRSTQVLRAVATIFLRRSDPEVTDKQIGQVKLLDFFDPDERMPDAGPPAEDPAANGSASEPAAAGALHSVESPSTPG